MNEFAGLIPMKQLHLGKSRLSAALNPIQREELVMNMFGRVLQASLNSSCVKVFVVGRDDRIKGITKLWEGIGFQVRVLI